MMNAIGSVINQIDSLVWGWWMIILLLGTHIFMTIRTGVIQRKIGTAIRLSVTKDTNAEGEVSQFGALTTCFHYWNRKYHRGRYCHCSWRSRCSPLVLAYRCLRNRHQIQ